MADISKELLLEYGHLLLVLDLNMDLHPYKGL